MGNTDINADTEALKKELIALLAARDARALKIISRLKKTAEQTGDDVLLGYAYYRYAYYYYFTARDSARFHRYLQLAIRHLLRNGDGEYLASAYNLVAYEAQDHNCYDIAYAYFMLALQVSEPLSHVAVSGVVGANAGRLLTELGYPKEGRRLIRNAIRRLLPFTSTNFYHYNMIFSYADEALCSFLLRDLSGAARILPAISALYDKASKSEQELGSAYLVLPSLYHALLSGNDALTKQHTAALCRLLSAMDAEDTSGLLFEMETLFSFMLLNGYDREAKKLLDASCSASRTDNLTFAQRYLSLNIRYLEKKGNTRKLRECLRAQHDLRKRHKEEQVRMYRYATEFVEMTESIAKERARALEERRLLQIRANTDALTKLPNRNDMNRTLEEMLVRARSRGQIFAIGILDVDRFKEYNDTFGHQVGDACLNLIGDVLRGLASDPQIYCARYGGDEFVVCFEGVSPQQIRRISARLCTDISQKSRQAKNGPLPADLSVSLGVCYGNAKENRQLWDFLSAADRTLYRVKKQGGGKHSLFLLR